MGGTPLPDGSKGIANVRDLPFSSDVDVRLLEDAAESSRTFVPSGQRILVVDDELVVLTVLREALHRGGFSVRTAASGEEALAVLKEEDFDLVLTDKNLPGVTGLEIAQYARTRNPHPRSSSSPGMHRTSRLLTPLILGS